MALELTDNNFKNTVIDSEKVSMVDFWAEWCPPCKMLGPIVDDLAKDYEGKAVIGKLNADNNPQVCIEYGVRNLPTILFFKGGKLVDKQVGMAHKATLEAKLKTHI